MDGTKFDQVARMLARKSDRRSAIKTMAAGSIGGAAISTLGAESIAAQDAPLEEWVRLYEDLAAAVDGITGDCADVVAAVHSFQEQRASDLARMDTELAFLTSDQVALHHEAHGGRVQQAAISIQLALTRCGYRPGSDSPFSVADITAFTDQATPVAFAPKNLKSLPLPAAQATPNPVQFDECDGVAPDQMCDCLCDKSFTVGNCIADSLACAFGGCAAPPSCCWAGICVAGYNHEQCVAQCGNCINVQTSC